MTLLFSELPPILLLSLQVAADCAEQLWDSPAKHFSTSVAKRVRVLFNVNLLKEATLKKQEIRRTTHVLAFI